MSETDPRALLELTWAGVPLWRCPFCPFDSTIRAKVVDHLEAAHPVPAPPDEPAAPEPKRASKKG